MIVSLRWIALAALLGSASALADPATSPPPAAQAGQTEQSAAPPSTVVRIPAGTRVQVILKETVSSNSSKSGQKVALELSEPIVIDGATVVPAGAKGTAEVVDAGPARMGGGQGKLQVSGRTLEINGVIVRIRGLNMLRAGEGLVGASTAVSVFISPLASIAIRGGDIEIPAGTIGEARIALDIDVPLPAASAAALKPAPAPAEALPAQQ